MKKEWNYLTQSEQNEYLKRARYLLDNCYVLDKDTEELAKSIYHDTKDKMEDGLNSDGTFN